MTGNKSVKNLSYEVILALMGNELIELTVSGDESPFLIESTEVEGATELSQASGHVEKEFDKLLKRIKPFCESIIDNFQNLANRPDTASAEFGLSISAGGNLFVVRASGEATIKIILNWNNMK